MLLQRTPTSSSESYVISLSKLPFDIFTAALSACPTPETIIFVIYAAIAIPTRTATAAAAAITISVVIPVVRAPLYSVSALDIANSTILSA